MMDGAEGRKSAESDNRKRRKSLNVKSKKDEAF